MKTLAIALIVFNVITMLWVSQISKDLTAVILTQQFHGQQITDNHKEMLERTHPEWQQKEAIKWILRR